MFCVERNSPNKLNCLGYVWKTKNISVDNLKRKLIQANLT